MSGSVRARLLARTRPSDTLRIKAVPADEVGAYEAAEDALRWARVELRAAQLKGDGQVPEAVQGRVDEAQAAVDAYYLTLHIEAMAPADLEALVKAHPPTAEQLAADKDRVWNPDTFPAAVLAESVAGDMSEEDWRTFLRGGPVSQGEVAALWTAAMRVNDRAPDVRTGKG